jgi:hypothetical protein
LRLPIGNVYLSVQLIAPALKAADILNGCIPFEPIHWIVVRSFPCVHWQKRLHPTRVVQVGHTLLGWRHPLSFFTPALLVSIFI